MVLRLQLLLFPKNRPQASGGRALPRCRVSLPFFDIKIALFWWHFALLRQNVMVRKTSQGCESAISGKLHKFSYQVVCQHCKAQTQAIRRNVFFVFLGCEVFV